MLGVHVDAVAGWLGSYQGADSPCDISRGIYAGQVGIPNLLDLFKKYDLASGKLERDVYDLGFARIGIINCYEIGFPEIARNCAIRGADILVVVSAFGMPRLNNWDLLTKSRALENGCFLIAANRIGKEKDSEFCGHSRIVSPRGEILTDAKLEETVITEELELEDISRQRVEVPYLRDYLARLNQ